MVKGKEGVDIARPIAMAKVWTDRGSGNKLNYQLWRPVPPNGFRALSDLPNFRTNKSNDDVDWKLAQRNPDLWCVSDKHCKASSIGNRIWTDAKTGSKQDGSIWKVNGSDFIIASGNHNKPNVTVYALK